MLDRSEFGAFVAATNYEIKDSSGLRKSIFQLRESIFHAMATARGPARVNGVVMFGDWVVFILKNRKNIPLSQWRQLLGLEDSSDDRPVALAQRASAPLTLPKNMILVPADVKLGGEIGIGSFGVRPSYMHTYMLIW